MDIHRPHHGTIAAAWERIESHLASLPAPLDAVARRLVAGIAGAEAERRSYFSHLLAPPLVYLPLWLQARFQREGRRPAQAAVDLVIEATMWGYLHIRIQDNQLDERDRPEPAAALLGNVCHQRMTRRLITAMGASPAFWDAFERAWIDFSRFTGAELAQLDAAGTYDEASFVAHARKVAFARVPMLAVAELSGRLDEPLEEAIGLLVDRLGCAYGLVNDLRGWPRDLRNGHRTYLLARAGIERDQIADVAAQDALAERVRGRLYEGGLLSALLDEARAWHRRAEEAGAALFLEEITGYTRERLAWLDHLEAEAAILGLRRALVRR